MLKKFFLLMACAAFLVSCDNDDDEKLDVQEKEVLTLDEHRFDVPVEGATVSVKMTSNVECTVTVGKFSSWISQKFVSEATYSFAISENEGWYSREGYIVFAGGILSDTVHVVQAGKFGKDFTESVSGLSFDMVYVKGGTFKMGAEDEFNPNESPVHDVTLSDYYIGKHEVTQGLWKVVMGKTFTEHCEEIEESTTWIPGKGDDRPMYFVGYNDALEFVKKLSELTGKKYVLPTEAQWEYAARGGEKSKGYLYSGSDNLDDVAWYYDTSDDLTHVVGTKLPNELGIYDMSGNVMEWCEDWYGSYSKSSQKDPHGPESGTARVRRGGCFEDFDYDLHVSYRGGTEPNGHPYFMGFRVALIPED